MNDDEERARLRAALRRMWEWQKTVQELLPDGLADEVQNLLSIGDALDSALADPAYWN